jgi:hypothetical protein
MSSVADFDRWAHATSGSFPDCNNKGPASLQALDFDGCGSAQLLLATKPHQRPIAPVRVRLGDKVVHQRNFK